MQLKAVGDAYHFGIKGAAPRAKCEGCDNKRRVRYFRLTAIQAPKVALCRTCSEAASKMNISMKEVRS